MYASLWTPNVLANAVNCGNGFAKEFTSLWFALAICSSSILGTQAGKVKCTSSSCSKSSFTVYRSLQSRCIEAEPFHGFHDPLLIADVKCQEEQEQKSFAAIQIPIEFLYWKCSTSKHDCWICFVNLAMIASLTSDGSTDPKHLHACFPQDGMDGSHT